MGLSPKRLAALFRQHTGLAMRRFTLWTRLQLAVAEIARGASLTDGALVAGFADGAHLTHTFRRMFGTTPSGSVARSLHPHPLVERPSLGNALVRPQASIGT